MRDRSQEYRASCCFGDEAGEEDADWSVFISVGRNVAEMELKLVMAVVVRGFDVLIDEGGGGWEEGMREGFLRKPGGLEVKVRRRVRGSKIGDGAAAVDAEGQDADISR